MTDADSFFRKHRPERFEEIVDQETAVAFLSAVIRRGQVGRNVLLHGPPGTGKTTLARIYAKASNCVAPTETGSPCLSCEFCQNFELRSRSDYREISGAEESGQRHAKRELEWARMMPYHGSRYRVLFIDEAQGLDKNAAAVFLKIAEEPPKHLVIVLATSEPNSLPNSIRTRFHKLDVKPLSSAGATALLCRTADLEGIDIEEQAIELLVSLAGGSARDLLQALERISLGSPGSITAADVALAFGLGEAEPLLHYFEALADGDVKRQIERWHAWREAASCKWPHVQNFLLYLFYTEVNAPKVEMTIDPMFRTIPVGRREALVERFRQRVENEGINFQQFWLDLMTLATSNPLEANERAIEVQVLQWQFRVNAPAVMSRDTDGLSVFLHHVKGDAARSFKATNDLTTMEDIVSPAVTALAKLSPRRRVRKGPRFDDDAASFAEEGDQTFLSYEDARRLVGAASFLIQEYDRFLNTTVLVSHTRLGNNEDSIKAAGLISSLVKAIGRLAKGAANGMHWIYVHDRDEEHGLHTRLALSLPRSYRAKTEARIRDFIAGLYPEASQNALAVSLGQPKLAVEERLVERHWICVRHLLRGVDPAYEVDDEAGRPVKLHKVLGVEAERRIVAGPLPPKRLEFSRSLGAGSRRRAEIDEGLPFLSAFDDWAWSHLTNGWERREAKERTRERNERVNQERRHRALSIRNGAVDEEALTKRLFDWRDTWPKRARDRRRSWPIWPER